MPKTFATCVALLLLPAAATAAGVKPGYWETTSQVLSPIRSTSTERRCVTPEQVSKFMSCYINHHYACACAEDTVAGGRLAFKGQCVEKKNGSKAGVVGAGTYTDTTLSMKADVTFKMMGLPMSGQAVIEARRLGDVCPAE